MIGLLVQESLHIFIFYTCNLTSKGISKSRFTDDPDGTVMAHSQSSLSPYVFGKLGDCMCPDSALISPPHTLAERIK